MKQETAAKRVVNAALLWWATREAWIEAGGTPTEDERCEALLAAEEFLAKATGAYRNERRGNG